MLNLRTKNRKSVPINNDLKEITTNLPIIEVATFGINSPIVRQISNIPIAFAVLIEKG